MESIALVAWSQTPSYRQYPDSEVSLIMDCVNDVLSHEDRKAIVRGYAQLAGFATRKRR